MKKLLAVVMASFLMLTACSSGGKDAASSGDAGSSGSSKEVTVWAWDPNFNIKALKIAQEKYNKTHPDVKIKIVEYAQADIIQKLNTGFNSGTTKGLPDAVLIEDYRAQGFIKSYPESFHELGDKVKGSDFADYKAGPTSLDGKQYGVPFDSGVAGLYIRTDYLKEAGYTLDDLKDIDWMQFIEIGKKIKEKTGKKLVALDPNDLGIIRMMAQSAGSWYVKDDGVTPDLADNAALKEAFKTYKAFMDADVAKMQSDWSQFLAAFNSGDVAAVPTGNWITASVKAEASQSGKWAVVPLPKLANVPNATHYSNLGGSSWYVLNTPAADAATDFLASTFGSDADFYQTLNKEINAIGTLNTAGQGAAYQEADPFFNNQKLTSDFAEWTKEIPKVNYGVNTYAIEDIMIVAMQNFLNGADVDSVMKDAQAQAETQVK
ncbi:extracellular solute-binding protein [Paenibacillus sp. JX-17]|uniref:Extracellular solute-binding protein n=1 Tax=Paenibacillus lacisoli TaxID=3064525 RepID=A0ABT9CIF7_9BACL|nr:extracellular solute-binding protein [Paenibacillus sp. JX-17]MDO7907722.1 extracellular solute-binding protein [Paenibacillus sp. JX-17]